MSSIIDDLIFYCWKPQTSKGFQNQNSQQPLEQLCKNFTINQGAILLNSNHNQYQIINKLRLQKHQYSIRVKTQNKLKSVRVEARLLQQNSFRIIDSKHKELLLLKEVARRQFQANSYYPFCIHKGCVLMVQNIYYFLFEPKQQRKIIQQYNSLFAKNFKEFERFIHQQANYIYKGTFKKLDSKININQDLFLAQIFCNSAINFDVSDDHTDYQTLQQSIKNKKSEVKRVTKNIVQNNVIEQSAQSLFLLLPEQLKAYWIKDSIQTKIQICSKNFEKMLIGGKFIGEKRIDDFIFNMVKINVKEIISTPFNQGGSCQLFLAKAQMIYINSVDNTSYLTNNQKKQKVIAIKKLKPQFNKKLKYKLQHQKNIVSKLKGVVSYFIPKYYRVEKELQTGDTLYMEFIQGDELDFFIATRQQTISLWTKICILLNIVNGMRHLTTYQITHLDLKPINIMVCKNNFLISKIIDFGQAYHPEVCFENFSPGYTFPYVAPQVYIKFDKENNVTKQQFTFSQKQDVFSFGIIMFESIFNSRIFHLTQNKFKQVYLRKQILQRFLFTYQRIQDYGEYIATSSLFYLITRCIDPFPERRPKFDWLAIALKIILNSCSGNSTV